MLACLLDDVYYEKHLLLVTIRGELACDGPLIALRVCDVQWCPMELIWVHLYAIGRVLEEQVIHDTGGKMSLSFLKTAQSYS